MGFRFRCHASCATEPGKALNHRGLRAEAHDEELVPADRSLSVLELSAES
jgi:hypothetical protein